MNAPESFDRLRPRQGSEFSRGLANAHVRRSTTEKEAKKKTRENSSRDWLGAFSKKIQQVWQASD
jgi:hypothetical protein